MKQPKQEVLVSCSKCTLRVPIGHTIYTKDGQNLMCFECYNKIIKGIEPEAYKTVQSAEMPKKINYICIACGFKFSRVETFHFGGYCFNCGKAHVQVENKIIETKDKKTLLDY